MSRTLFALLSVLLLPLAAFAHGMMMSDPKVKDGQVTVEVFYDDDTPVGDAKMRLFNAAKEVVLEGTTDAKGAWTFPAPPPGEYTIRAKTDDGHAAKRSFTVPDAPPSADAPPVESATARPPRLLYLGFGVLGITAAFTLFYLVRRRRRPAASSTD